MGNDTLITQGQSDFLNLSRWLAALLVVLEHARSLLFIDYRSLESPSSFHKGFYFLTGFGHEAVVVFFVISGFLVGGKSWSLWNERRFAWRCYFADRISRLYTVLIFALLIGWGLDLAGTTWFNSFGYYDHSTMEEIAVVSTRFDEQLSVHHFLGNLLMVQNIQISTFGSNGPLWSLAHEWWYYLLFPMILCLFRGTWQVRAICLAGLIALGCFLTWYILILFGVWLLGVVGWWSNERRWLPWWLTLGLFAGALVIMRLEIELVPYAHQFLLGIGYLLLLNSLAEHQQAFPFRKTSTMLAEFSYSLYLVHFPVMLFLISFLFSQLQVRTRLEMGAQSISLFIAVVALAVGSSYLVSLVTEARTATVRNHLYHWLGVKTSK